MLQAFEVPALKASQLFSSVHQARTVLMHEFAENLQFELSISEMYGRNHGILQGETPKWREATIMVVVNYKVEVMEYYRDSNGFWRIKNFRRRRRARI